MIQMEKDIERALKHMVEQREGLCLKWVCPGWSGVPDRIILLPGGRIIFAEIKRPKGSKVGTLQEWWARKLTMLGFEHWVIWSRGNLEEFRQALDGASPGWKQEWDY